MKKAETFNRLVAVLDRAGNVDAKWTDGTPEGDRLVNRLMGAYIVAAKVTPSTPVATMRLNLERVTDRMIDLVISGAPFRDLDDHAANDLATRNGGSA